MKGRPELDSCSEEGDPVQTFLQIRQILFINLDVNYLHKFKRTVYNFISLEKVLVSWFEIFFNVKFCSKFFVKFFMLNKD